MSFFNKLFKNIVKSSEKEEGKTSEPGKNSSIDERFVKQFIHKGGKFLYCSDLEEAETNLIQILQENQWNNVISFHKDLQDFLSNIKSAKTEKIRSPDILHLLKNIFVKASQQFTVLINIICHSNQLLTKLRPFYFYPRTKSKPQITRILPIVKKIAKRCIS